MNKILASLCFIAVLPLPYAYYMFLRPALCLGIVYLLIKDWDKLSDEKKAISIVIAIIFNPFFPIQHIKAIWVLIDIASGYFLYKKYPTNT